VLWRPQEGADSVLWSGLSRPDALIGLARDPDGAQSFVAVDPLTGERRWTTPLAQGRPVPDDGDALGGCTAVPEVADRALCLVTDAYRVYGPMTVDVVPGEVSTLVVLDTADGTVVAQHPAPAALGFAALAGLAVVHVPAADGGVTLTAWDLDSGERRWRRTLPPVPRTTDDASTDGSTDGSTWISATADTLGVIQPPGVASLLDAEGTVVRTGIDAQSGLALDPVTGTVTVLTHAADGSLRTTFIGPGADVVRAGTPVTLLADDGSLPGLVLMADSDLRAYDRDATDPRWSVRGGIAGNALVLRGRVYASTDSGLVALDGRTGEELWRATAPAGRTLGGVVTDGRHLLSVQQRPDASGEVTQDDWPGVGELAAYRFEDGGEDWRTDLPDGLMGAWSTGSTLVGWGPEGSAVIG
jgi:outer membrane protein assembly factor BamB